MNLISKRANGELLTPASWIRNEVVNHPAYKGDSVVSEEIAADLLVACKEIGEGKRACPELLGTAVIEPITPDCAYPVELKGHITEDDRSSLIQSLFSRASELQAFYATKDK